ncbi:MAG: hypothetical protein AAF658_08445, partial [Myxococcota bacterium]
MRFLLFAALTLSVGCAPAWKSTPHDALFQVAKEDLIRLPREREVTSDWWEAGLSAGVRPLGQALSPSTYVDAAIGGRPSLDVNAFGEVPESSWFVPRIGRTELSPADVFRGTQEHPPPAPGPLVVISGKTEGSTPGFVVRDSANVVWFVKFDPPAYPALATGAEMIASRALAAAGWNVPETHLVELDVSGVLLDPKATTRDKYGTTVPLTGERLSDFFILLNPDNAGRTRAIFSRRIEGVHLGPFDWRGVDPHDPNDLIPHERRRSLRALWVFFAWLNNTDTKSSNTLDTFIYTDEKRGRVRHYLLDLGDSLGAAGHRTKYRHEGYEAYFDWGEAGRRLVSLGFRYPYWLGLKPPESRTLGPFEAEIFDPARWSPQFPNAAFQEATPDDTFWGAQLLARFDREVLGALVDAADYEDPTIRDRVLERLTERRLKVLAYAFDGYTAIDRPVTRGNRLTFTDLRARSGLPVDGPLEYRVTWNDGDALLEEGRVSGEHIDLTQAIAKARSSGALDDEP